MANARWLYDECPGALQYLICMISGAYAVVHQIHGRNLSAVRHHPTVTKFKRW